MGDINQERPDLVQRGWTQDMWDARQSQDWTVKALTTDDDFGRRWADPSAALSLSPEWQDKRRGVQAAPQAGGAPGLQGAPEESDLEKFRKAMMGPLDMESPEIKAMISTITQKVRQTSYNRGLAGGVSDGAVAAHVSRGLLDEKARRAELGLRATSIQQGAYQFDTMRRDQQEASAYEQQKANTQAAWSAVGGLAGGLAGNYFPNSGLNAQTGSQLGGGLSGGLYGPPKVSTTQSPNNPSYKSGGGLTGGR
jgi:hypothetical protein